MLRGAHHGATAKRKLDYPLAQKRTLPHIVLAPPVVNIQASTPFGGMRAPSGPAVGAYVYAKDKKRLLVPSQGLSRARRQSAVVFRALPGLQEQPR